MVATRHVTVKAFETMPLDGAWELVNGELVALTPAAGRSSRIGGRIYGLIADRVEPSGFGWAFPADAGFILYEDRQTVRSPDAAFVHRDRLSEVPDGFIPLAPDLAVEVLSPSDRMSETLAKIAMYLDAGVHLIWLVDPGAQTVTVFTADHSPVMLDATGILDGGEILPGFSVPVAELFA